MAEDVESLEYRRQARANGYKYGPIFIYKRMDMALQEYGMPHYSLRTSVGAIEAFAGLLQNIGDAVKEDATNKMGQNLPGVNTPSADFGLDLSISGPMYMLGYDDFINTQRAIDRMAHRYGWETHVGGIAVTYRPNTSGASSDLYSEDPITAASRAMMLSAYKHLETSALVLKQRGGSGSDETYAKNIVALEGCGIGTTMKSARDAFTANTGRAVAAKWYNAGYAVEAYRANVRTAASVNVVPSHLTVTPQAYVVDDTSQGVIYPTRLDISISLANPYGKLIATTTDKE